MPVVKLERFKRGDVQVARVAKAFSHPARVAILRELARRNECVCGEIVDLIPLAQATVSQHLKELKDLGLIKGEIDGPRSCYCINWEVLTDLRNDLSTFLENLTSRCTQC
jgi:DNA-binding transcriptional ArsR family regulator